MQRPIGIASLLTAGVLALLGLAGCGGSGGGSGENPSDPSVAMGAHLFVQFACSSCHGEQGKGGANPYVPGLVSVSKLLTPAQLSNLIAHGIGERDNPLTPYMPVWGPVISKSQIADLAAYIRAGLPKVKDTTPVAVPTEQGPAVAGAALYIRYGCINCHGPSGLGGVPNPLSEDKTVPALSGQGFREEFNTDAKIKDMIRTGSYLGRPPIASMPHWGDIISENDLSALVAYLKTLK